MSRDPALEVRCPHCMAAPREHCMAAQAPGKEQRTRRPLKFSRAHPQRVALAACLAAGASAEQAAAAAKASVTYSYQGAESLPYIEVARAAIADAARVSIGAYRKVNPPAPNIFDGVPDLFTVEEEAKT